MKKSIHTDNAPKAVGPYSQAIVSNNLVFTSGQIHLNSKSELVNGTIGEKTKQVMNNLSEVLAAAGLSFDNVLKVTIYVTDMSNYAEINEVYATYLKEPFPARELICVKALPLGADIEISMIASK
jgi:2-iminobutanoate/2-iminopropanoate deaminase